MRKQRTHYDKAFKENAVKLSFERKNVSDLAHELGISPALLYRWHKSTGNEGKQFPRQWGPFSRRRAGRVAELEKRLKEAETERDILKALGIISTSDR